MESCCFTGHRTIPAADRARLAALVLSAMRQVYRRGVRRFFCGGAVGFDLLAAQAVLAAREKCPGLSLSLLLPCADQCRGWRAEDIALYEDICRRSDEVRVLAPHYYDGVMRLRNEALVDAADICIAYCTREASGAAQTVRLARRKGIEVLNLADSLQTARDTL